MIQRVASSLGELLADAELVVLAAPPLAVLDLLDALAEARRRGELGQDATITDVASTKGEICRRAAALGLPFVGGHPMAGREASGFAAARSDLFVGRPWILVPTPPAREVDEVRVRALVAACRAVPVVLDAETHDEAVAAVSHLPLLLSVLLAEAVAAPETADAAPSVLPRPLLARLAASGWRDVSRLARGDPEMGAGILVTNAFPIAQRLARVAVLAEEWRALLEGRAEAEVIRSRLAGARDAILELEAETSGGPANAGEVG
jgi:prephenate dehydrogenase